MCVLNLSAYLEQSEHPRLKAKIEKCPDANAYLVFDLVSRQISAMSGSETMSMMSGMMGTDATSMDSGPDSFFNENADGADGNAETSASLNNKIKKAGRLQRPASTGPQGLPRAPSMPASSAKGILAISGGVDAPPDIIRESPEEESIEAALQPKTIKIDRSKIKIIKGQDHADKQPEEADSQQRGDPSSKKLHLKLKQQIIEKSTSMVNIEHQKQIDGLRADKARLNEQYQRQLQTVLREKEEIHLQLSSYEDKVQKMDLDRETLKLKNKQMAAENTRQGKQVEELS